MTQNNEKRSKKKPMQIVYIVIIFISIGMAAYTLQSTQDLRESISWHGRIISEINYLEDFLSSQNDQDYHIDLIKVDSEVSQLEAAGNMTETIANISINASLDALLYVNLQFYQDLQSYDFSSLENEDFLNYFKQEYLIFYWANNTLPSYSDYATDTISESYEFKYNHTSALIEANFADTHFYWNYSVSDARSHVNLNHNAPIISASRRLEVILMGAETNTIVVLILSFLVDLEKFRIIKIIFGISAILLLAMATAYTFILTLPTISL